MSFVDRLEFAIPNPNRSKVCNGLVRRDLTEPAEQFLDRTGKSVLLCRCGTVSKSGGR